MCKEVSEPPLPARACGGLPNGNMALRMGVSVEFGAGASDTLALRGEHFAPGPSPSACSVLVAEPGDPKKPGGGCNGGSCSFLTRWCKNGVCWKASVDCPVPLSTTQAPKVQL